MSDQFYLCPARIQGFFVSVFFLIVPGEIMSNDSSAVLLKKKTCRSGLYLSGSINMKKKTDTVILYNKPTIILYNGTFLTEGGDTDGNRDADVDAAGTTSALVKSAPRLSCRHQCLLHRGHDLLKINALPMEDFRLFFPPRPK